MSSGASTGNSDTDSGISFSPPRSKRRVSARPDIELGDPEEVRNARDEDDDESDKEPQFVVRNMRMADDRMLEQGRHEQHNADEDGSNALVTWSYRAAKRTVQRIGDYSKLTGTEDLNDVISRILVLLRSISTQKRRLTKTETAFLADAWLTFRYKLSHARLLYTSSVTDYTDIILRTLQYSEIPSKTFADVQTTLSELKAILPKTAGFTFREIAGTARLSWLKLVIWLLSGAWDAITCDALQTYSRCVATVLHLVLGIMRREPALTPVQADVPGWTRHDKRTETVALTLLFIRDTEPWCAGLLNTQVYIDRLFGPCAEYSSVREFTLDERMQPTVTAWAKSNFDQMEYNTQVKYFMDAFLMNAALPGDCFKYNKSKDFKPNEPREAIEVERSVLFQVAVRAHNARDKLFADVPIPGVPRPLFKKAKDIAELIGCTVALERDCNIDFSKHHVSYSQFECFGPRVFEDLRFPAIASVGDFHLLLASAEGTAEPLCRCSGVTTAVCAFVAHQLAQKKTAVLTNLWAYWTNRCSDAM